jgi:hypothetical protein
MLTMVDSVLTTRGKKKLGGERNALIVEICALLVEDDRASALALSCALADFGIVFHLANSLSGARRCLLDLSHHIDAVLLVPASPKHHPPWLARPAKTPMILGMPLVRT